MVNRVWFVGSSKQTAQQIEDSFKDTLALLEPHLAERPYLLGARPAFGDFGLWGQLYSAHRDPTPRRLIEHEAPNTLRWIERMRSPQAEGDFEPWERLEQTLKPLLIDQVAGLFLPWACANARAIEAGAESFEVILRSGQWSQKPQKYHARSLAALRARYAEAADDALDDLLADCGCLEFLKAA
jgi:hypothetical protein